MAFDDDSSGLTHVEFQFLTKNTVLVLSSCGDSIDRGVHYL